MKNLITRKNTSLKSVNNHKITNHKFCMFPHNVSKELLDVYMSMAPIYQALDVVYANIDLIDFDYYERWLNE